LPHVPLDFDGLLTNLVIPLRLLGKLNSCASLETVDAVALLLVLLQVLPALAWVFPEHRDIAVLAVQKLSSDQQAQLQALWAEARGGHEARLCAQAADPSQSARPNCIDFAAMASDAATRI
jgi:hypothetical protein